MRILVTGASGFIGRWVVVALRNRKHEVIAVSRTGRSSTDPANEGVSWKAADLLRQGEIESLIEQERPDGLIHCAWDTTPGTYWTTCENLKWMAASLQLMEAFVRRGGQRAVVAGTSAEYCWKSDKTLNETHSKVAPDTLYGISKNSLRQVLEQWTQSTKLSLAWGRIFCPFGPGENPARLIPRLFEQLNSGQALPFDSGRLVRDFLSVQDLGEAFAALFDSDLEGSVNVASGEDTSIRDVVTWIAECVEDGDVEFGVLPDPDGQPTRIVADVSRLRDDVGWKPTRSVKEQIRETCDWWRTHKITTDAL